MSIRSMMFGLLALLVAGGTALFVQSYVAQPIPLAMAPIEAPRTNVKGVLVAKEAMPLGHFIRPEDLRWQEWPENALVEGYLTQGTKKLEELTGAVVRFGIAAGEPITESRLVHPGDRGFLAAILPAGKRAVTVAVTATSGNAGFIFPGDHVDLMMMRTLAPPPVAPNAPPGQIPMERKLAETILADVRVLAIDQRFDDLKGQVMVAHTATLEVTPKEAEIITVAVEMGKLNLSLRSVGADPEGYDVKGQVTFDAEATKFLTAPPLPGAAPSAPRKLNIVRAASAEEVDLSGDNRAGQFIGFLRALAPAPAQPALIPKEKK